MRNLATEIFEAIKHGDTEHQRWLREKLTEFFANKTEGLVAEAEQGRSDEVASEPLPVSTAGGGGEGDEQATRPDAGPIAPIDR